MKLLLIALSVCSLAMAQVQDGLEMPLENLPVPATASTTRTGAGKTIVQYCGRKLAYTLALLCSGATDPNDFGISPYNNLIESGDWSAVRGSRGHRIRRSLIMECCYSGCTVADMMEFC